MYQTVLNVYNNVEFNFGQDSQTYFLSFQLSYFRSVKILLSLKTWLKSSFPKFSPSKNLILFFQFSSVAQSCPTLCNPMNLSTPGLPVHHQLLEFTQTHIHQVCDAIQPSHPLSSLFSPAPNPSQHQSFPMSQHEVAKVEEFQL